MANDKKTVSGPVEIRVRGKLEKFFQPSHLEVENESHQHNVPAGSETHFRVVIVSDRFKGLPKVARHRLVHEALQEELATGQRGGGIHALTQKTLSEAEWKESGMTSEGFQSPACASKK